jgi:hypothetical protein
MAGSSNANSQLPTPNQTPNSQLPNPKGRCSDAWGERRFVFNPALSLDSLGSWELEIGSYL